MLGGQYTKPHPQLAPNKLQLNELCAGENYDWGSVQEYGWRLGHIGDKVLQQRSAGR